jgi:hypothetical protein
MGVTPQSLVNKVDFYKNVPFSTGHDRAIVFEHQRQNFFLSIIFSVLQARLKNLGGL